jgi:DNA adenine methylase
MQQLAFAGIGKPKVAEFTRGLLKWIGNKQRFAAEIITNFPSHFGTYFEPFVGSGGVLSTLAPSRAVASDSVPPLIEIWRALVENPALLKKWYEDRWHLYMADDRVAQYEQIKASYNARPNGPDLLFLCRSCYGGVVRFRQSDGYMSTPCGIHSPILPASFGRRVDEWADRVRGTEFRLADYTETMTEAKPGDLVYCDPPYSDTQSILYGAQAFNLGRLLDYISQCKERGVYVALSIDGTKRSGRLNIDLPIPPGLFEREVSINCGRSMLRRFQMNGESLDGEVVTDRLLLTY